MMPMAGKTGASGMRPCCHWWGFSSSEGSSSWLGVCLLPLEWVLPPIPQGLAAPVNRCQWTRKTLPVLVPQTHSTLSHTLVPPFPLSGPSFPSNIHAVNFHAMNQKSEGPPKLATGPPAFSKPICVQTDKGLPHPLPAHHPDFPR